MEQSALSAEARPVFGWIGFLTGACALLGALFIFWAGPFAPQQAVGVSLGDIAADIGKSALRSVAGKPQPAPEPVPRDLDDMLKTGIALLGGLAVIFAAVSLIRRETLRPAYAAAFLGFGAIAFQFFAAAFYAMLAALLIAALVHSFGDFFSGLFGG